MVRLILYRPVLTLAGTASVMAESMGFVAGNLPAFLILAALVAAISFFRRTGGKQAALLVLMGTTLMFAILFLMISRAHFIIALVPRRMLYPYPLSYVFVVFLAISIKELIGAKTVSRGAVQILLLALLASNITTLPNHWMILMNDRDVYTLAMIRALRSPLGITRDMRNDPELGSYYSDVEKSGIYSTLRQRVNTR